MAKFIGTEKEFKIFLNGYCKNKVNAITKKARKSHDNICEHCHSSVKELQSAHIKGKECKVIIHETLEKFGPDSQGIYFVDLEKFEKYFKEAHLPFEEHFKFLCESCHRKYDKK
jgi:hypothetical protein